MNLSEAQPLAAAAVGNKSETITAADGFHVAADRNLGVHGARATEFRADDKYEDFTAVVSVLDGA